MAVAKMNLVSIIGVMPRLDQVIHVCTQSGVFEPDDALTFFSDTTGFTLLQEASPYTELMNTISSTAYAMTGATLQPDTAIQTADFEENAAQTYTRDLNDKVSALLKKRTDLSEERERISTDKEQFEHFIGLNVDLDSILHCESFHVRFGRLPIESYEKLAAFNDNPFVLFFPGAKDEVYYWGAYFAPVEKAAQIDYIFSSLYFERMRIPDATGTPQEVVASLAKKLTDLQAQLDDIQVQLTALWQTEQAACRKLYSQLYVLNRYFGYRQYAARYNENFIMAGWIPQKQEKKFRHMLDSVPGIEYSIQLPDSDSHHTPPVLLENPRLFRPFEFFVKMYGLPNYNEPDPTNFVALTYTILFGAMFGDVGQGLLLALIGWLMWKLKKMQIGRILVPCGFSAAIFGCCYGSVFGFEHLLDPLYSQLFGWQSKPIEVMDSSTAVNIIFAAVGIGVALIVMSMLINIYSGLRRRDYESALFGQNGLAGLVFFLGLTLGAVGALLLGWPVFNWYYITGVVIVPLLLMFFREPLGHLVKREFDQMPESWGEYITQNIFEVFEILLSYLSNVMSFLRVGAFVLIHAGMMMAVFTLAGLVGNPIGYWAIVIFGNALVMCMEALLVAIQVLRLEYYEMFSRYYTGDGRAFTPMSLIPSEEA